MNKEVRYSPIVFRNLEEDSRRLEGRAIVFDSYSNNLGFYEKINRSAVTQELINHSDIIFTFNHDPNQLLARFRNGGGSLDVQLREDGVYFSFDIPNTTLGNDIYELIKRGDISNCSFCFSISDEKEAQKWEKRDGKMYREIFKIGGLYDLSAVTYPAYSDTDINARSLEMRNIAEAELDKIIKEAEEMKEEQEKEKEQEIRSEEVEVEKPEEEKEPEQEVREEEKPEEVEIAMKPVEEEEEKPAEEKEEKREINKENKNNINIMNKTFIKEIRNAIDNNQRSFTVNAETRDSDTSKKMTVNGYTVGSGQDAVDIDGTAAEGVVETEMQGLLEPLYANSVLSKLGVRWYKGLPQGNLSVPVMDGGNVGWSGEIDEAVRSGNAFSHVDLTPKRLTAFVDISKQLIAQDTISAEAAIRRDIVNALNDKLEKTVLGLAAGDATKPAGIFYGATVTKNETYAKVCTAEASVEDNGVGGEWKYLLSPAAKAFYRSLPKGQNNTGMVFDHDEMDGTPAVVSSMVDSGKYIYANFNFLAVASWGNIEVTVDPYTQAANGMIRLVINSYWDAKILRPQAFYFGKIA